MATTTLETMMMALLGPKGCIAGRQGGVLEKGYTSPEMFMMASMISDANDRERFLAVGSSVSGEERESMFFRIDEAQALEAASEAVVKGYTALLEKYPSLKKMLKETDKRMLAYHGGFRSLLLDQSDEGYGYNVVGRTLEGMRHALNESSRARFKGFTALESPLTIGLVVLCVRVGWELLITGQDNLKGFLGKSAFEILALCGVSYTETTLRSMHQAFQTRNLRLEHLDHHDLQRLVEYEFRYPGNLVGFLRKRGIHYHMESLRGGVYRALWLAVGNKVMETRHPEIAPELRAISILSSSSPGAIERSGPRLLTAWVQGKVVVDDGEFSDKVTAILDSRILLDALHFVPKFYPLQNEATTSVFTLFDYYDIEDAGDMLSPSYPTNLRLEEGLEFPTILHYVYFSILVRYFPSWTKKAVYEHCMRVPSTGDLVEVMNDTMKTRLDEVVRARRRDLLTEGVTMRVRSNPVLMQPVSFFGLENEIHAEALSAPSLPEATAVALSFCMNRTELFPELDLVFTSFHKAVHDGHMGLGEKESQIIFRVWTALYEKLVTWSRFLQKLYPRSHDNWVAIFFETFYPSLHALLQLPTPPDQHAEDAEFYTIEITESMAQFFLSFTESACKPLMARVQPLWTPYAKAYLRSIAAYKRLTGTTLDVPRLLLCPPAPLSTLSTLSTLSNLSTTENDLESVTRAMVHVLKPLWNYFHAEEPKRTAHTWDDQLLLLLAWAVMGQPVRDHLLPLKRYLIEETRLKINKLAVHRDPETGEETMVPIPTTVVKKKKKEVDLVMCSRFPSTLVDQHLGFLADHPGTLLRLSYLLPEMKTVARMSPDAARVFAARPAPETHIHLNEGDD